MKDYKALLIAFLVGIAIFSVFKYVSSVKESNDLLASLKRIKEQAAALENEKQNLLETIEKEKELEKKLAEQNIALQGNLKTNEEKLSKLNADFAGVQKAVEELQTALAVLRDENAALREEKDKLNLELNEVTREKETLEARFNSIVELKKAIKDLKRKMREIKIDKPRQEREKKTNLWEFGEGNRGFLIKDGKSTFPPRVVIEVNPPAAVDDNEKRTE